MKLLYYLPDFLVFSSSCLRTGHVVLHLLWIIKHINIGSHSDSMFVISQFVSVYGQVQDVSESVNSPRPVLLVVLASPQSHLLFLASLTTLQWWKVCLCIASLQMILFYVVIFSTETIFTTNAEESGGHIVQWSGILTEINPQINTTIFWSHFTN